MNVHSGMEALFMPYDHLATIPKGDTAHATLQVIQKVFRALAFPMCTAIFIHSLHA